MVQGHEADLGLQSSLRKLMYIDWEDYDVANHLWELADNVHTPALFRMPSISHTLINQV